MINNVEIGNYHFQTGSLDDAMRYYKKALKLAKSIPDSIEAKRDMSVSFINLANSYSELGNISKAESYLENAKIVIRAVLEHYPYGDFNDILRHINERLKTI